MKGERDGVRAKLKRRKIHVLSDESDVEIVEIPMAVSKEKRRCEGSPEDIKKPIPIRLRFSVSMTYNSFQRASTASGEIATTSATKLVIEGGSTSGAAMTQTVCG
jgi:hypothetical protein